MTAKLHAAGLGILLALGSGIGNAQIRDNDASANLLSIHCAVSGGGQVQNYSEYSRKLAKTIAHLDSGQQYRVFGFVPQPVAANAGNGENGGSQYHPDYNPDFHGTLPNRPVNTVPGDSSAGGGSAEGGNPDEQNGTSGSGETASSSSEGEQGTNSQNGSNWWEELGDWIEDIVEDVVEGVNQAEEAGWFDRSPGKGDGNNGHGNDPGKFDPSNPGNKKK